MQGNERPGADRPEIVLEDRLHRARQIRKILKSLQRFARAKEGQDGYIAALHAIRTARLALAYTRRDIRVLEEAIAKREVETFAIEWITQHGVTRGMPRGWDRKAS